MNVKARIPGLFILWYNGGDVSELRQRTVGIGINVKWTDYVEAK